MCDEMLARLGRWLRAAGYDTAIAAESAEDAAILATCIAERRVLLTRDRHLAAAASDRIRVVLLTESALDAQAHAVKEALGIDWLHAPFSRCVVDNSPLVAAEPDAVSRVPVSSRAAGGPLWRCPVCARLYWPGGHVRRMQQRLAAWSAAKNAAGRGLSSVAPQGKLGSTTREDTT